MRISDWSSDVCSSDLYAKAREIAERIAKAAPLGVQAVLKATRLAAVEGEGKAIPTLFDNMIPVMKSDDAKEGVQSFVERREERFQGRSEESREGKECVSTSRSRCTPNT